MDSFGIEPTVALSFGAGILERLNKRAKLGFALLEQVDAGGQHFTYIAVAPGGHSFGGELLQVRRKGDVHG